MSMVLICLKLKTGIGMIKKQLGNLGKKIEYVTQFFCLVFEIIIKYLFFSIDKCFI